MDDWQKRLPVHARALSIEPPAGAIAPGSPLSPLSPVDLGATQYFSKFTESSLPPLVFTSKTRDSFVVTIECTEEESRQFLVCGERRRRLNRIR